MTTIIIDNVPDKITAHAVRRLRPCAHCGGIGDRDLMVDRKLAGYIHTKCFIKVFPFRYVLEMPAVEQNKFRLCDLGVRRMQQLLGLRSKQK